MEEDVVSVSIDQTTDFTPQDEGLDVKLNYSEAELQAISLSSQSINETIQISSLPAQADVIENDLAPNLQETPESEDLKITQEDQSTKQLKLHNLNEDFHSQLDLLQKDSDSLRNKTQELQEEVKNSKAEKESLSKNYDERLENLTSYCQSLSQEMEELDAINKSLLKQLDNTSGLLKTLEDKYRTKNNECEELQLLMESRDKRKNSSEIMLVRQEKVNKDLADTNSKLQVRIKELEKKLEESMSRYNKVRQEISQVDSILKERDEQMHKALKRIKLQDVQISEVQKDNRNKETAIAKLHKTLQVINIDAQRELNLKLERELKTAVSNLVAKEDEVEVLRDLVKSYQIQFKQKEFEVSRYRKNYKLNPLVKEPIIDQHLSTTSLKTTSSIRKIIRIPETTSPTPLAAKGNRSFFKDKLDHLSNSFNKTASVHNQHLESQPYEPQPFESEHIEDHAKDISEDTFSNTQLSEFQPNPNEKPEYEISINHLQDMENYSQALDSSSSSQNLSPEEVSRNYESKSTLKVPLSDSLQDSDNLFETEKF